MLAETIQHCLRVTRREMALTPFWGGNPGPYLLRGIYHQPCPGRDALRAGMGTKDIGMLTYSPFPAVCMAAVKVLTALPAPSLKTRW